MRSHTAPDLAFRCRRCYLHTGFCLCGEVKVFDTRTRIIVVRHALEAWKTTNTARIAHLALPNSMMLEHGGPATRFDDRVLAQPDTWLLYPDGKGEPVQDQPPKQLVVLDGTWAQARRMLQRIPALRGLPRLVLPEGQTSVDRLRQAPNPHARSTIEAIADALTTLGEPVAGRSVHELSALMVSRVRAMRSAGGPLSPRAGSRHAAPR